MNENGKHSKRTISQNYTQLLGHSSEDNRKKEKKAYEAVDKSLRTLLGRIILATPRLTKWFDRIEEALAPAELYSQTEPDE